MSKVVALTGGASGIGAATVARLLAAGCRVYVLDVAAPGEGTDRLDEAKPLKRGQVLAQGRPVDAALNREPADVESRSRSLGEKEDEVTDGFIFPETPPADDFLLIERGKDLV